MDHLNITPQKCRWYICENYTIVRGPQTREEMEKTIKNEKGIDKMILAGPFDSEEEANSRINQYSKAHEPFVWHCTID